MTRGAGVVRSAASLATAADEIAAMAPGTGELANLVEVARALIAAATGPGGEPGWPPCEGLPRPSEAFSHRFGQ